MRALAITKLLVAVTGFCAAATKVESENRAGKCGQHRYDPLVLIGVQGLHAEGRDDHQAANAHERQHATDGSLRKVETTWWSRIRGWAMSCPVRIAHKDNQEQGRFGDEQRIHDACSLSRVLF